MAIDRTGISSLDAGASDITYTGDQGPKSPDQQLMASADPMLVEEYQKYVFEMEEQGLQPISFKEFIQQVMSESRQGGAYGGTAHPTYTQSRRQRINAAGGGIMGSNAGSMLVAPTADGSRPGYGILRKIKKRVKKLIPNEIKAIAKSPIGKAALLAAGSMLIPGIGGAISSGLGSLGTAIAGPGTMLGSIPGMQTLGSLGSKALTGLGTVRGGLENLIGAGGQKLGIPGADQWFTGGIMPTGSGMDYGIDDAGLGVKINPATGLPEQYPGGWQALLKQQVQDKVLGNIPQKAQEYLQKFGIGTGGAGTQQGVAWKRPLAIGTAMGAIQAAMPKAKLPTDTSGIDMASAIRGDELRFRPPESALLAEGGRIGYRHGKDFNEATRRHFKNVPLTEYEKEITGYSPGDIAYEKEMFRELLKSKSAQEKKDLLHWDDEYTMGHRAMEYSDDPIFEEFYETGEHFNKGGIAQLAQGGRIGYERGRVVRPGGYAGAIDRNIANLQTRKELYPNEWTEEDEAELQRQLGAKGGFADKMLSGDPVPETEDEGSFWDFLPFVGKAQGGRIRAQEGGLMDLGGMEKDYRQEGGFVPLGGQEKADDVPARLSKNEFVFTADAVRAAGGGDIDAGAEVMENVMENLEQGGQVSEESQGLEGARNMFATAQRLEGVM